LALPVLLTTVYMCLRYSVYTAVCRRQFRRLIRSVLSTANRKFHTMDQCVTCSGRTLKVRYLCLSVQLVSLCICTSLCLVLCVCLSLCPTCCLSLSVLLCLVICDCLSVCVSLSVCLSVHLVCLCLYFCVSGCI